MEFNKKSKPRSNHQILTDDLEQKYPLNVLLYEKPPCDSIKLIEFEEIALERLQLLRIYEQAQARNLRILSDDWKEFINKEVVSEGLKGYMRLLSAGGSHISMDSNKYEFEIMARRNDYLSHFILRLCYCRTHDLIKWYVIHEIHLFKHRFSVLSSSEIKQFIDFHHLNYEVLTTEEKNAIKNGLIESTIGHASAKIELMDFFKVPFQQAIDLIRNRRCYLRNGYAYVSIHDIITMVGQKQQEIIEDGLKNTQLLLDEVDSDERLYYFVKSLHKSYIGKNYGINTNNAVPIECLDDLSKKSYPLCMRLCHEHLRNHHHLKHDGRMQYGLFLKGIGVTVEDSIRFWRDEFTKLMPLEKFSRSYQYSIEHNYGKKGSCVNYTPYSCLKIIKDVITSGIGSGCPFKLYEQNTLKQKLLAIGLPVIPVQDVLRYASKGHYQLACGKYFQIMHNTIEEMSINHPNQYFEQSQIIMNQTSSEKSHQSQQNASNNVMESNKV